MEERPHSPTLFPAATSNNDPSQLFDLIADKPDIVDFLLDCDGVVYSPRTELGVACLQTFIPFKLANTIAQTVAAGKSLDNKPNEQGTYETTITPCTARDTHQEWNNITKKSNSPRPNTRWLNAFTPMIYQNLSQATQAKLSFASSKQDALADCFEHNGYPGATFDRTYYTYLLQLLQREGELDSNLIPQLETEKLSKAKELEIHKNIDALINTTYSNLGLTYHKEMDLDIAVAEIPRATATTEKPGAIRFEKLLMTYHRLGQQALKEITDSKSILDQLPAGRNYTAFKTKVIAQIARLQNIIKFNAFTLADGSPKESKDITLADYQRREMSAADIIALEEASQDKTNQPLQSKAREIIKAINTKLIDCLPKMNKILNIAKSLTAAGKTHLKAKLYQPTMRDKKGQVLDCLNEKSKRHPGKNMVEIFIDDSDVHCNAVASIKAEEIPAGITLYVYRYAPELPKLREFIPVGKKIVGTKPMQTAGTSLITENLDPNLNRAANEGIVCAALLEYLGKTNKPDNGFPTYLLDAIDSTFRAHPIGQPDKLTPEQYNDILYQKLIEAAVAHPEEALTETALLDDMTGIARELNFTPLFYPLGAEVARRKTYELAARNSDVSVESDRTTVGTTQAVGYSYPSPDGSV
jgi:hypothetical protein